MYVLKVYILKQKQTTSVVKIASEKFYNLNHLVLSLKADEQQFKDV
jgi:hypothetical protein